MGKALTFRNDGQPAQSGVRSAMRNDPVPGEPQIPHSLKFQSIVRGFKRESSFTSDLHCEEGSATRLIFSAMQVAAHEMAI